MTSFLAWVWTPLVLLAVCGGLGLLLEALTRTRLPAALLAPIGLCLGVLLVIPAYEVGATDVVVAVVLCALAIAGVALGRRGLLERLRPGPAAAAALATYGLYLAPVVLSGSWTWAGYNYTNDPANTLTAAAWILGHGATPPAEGISTSANVAAMLMDSGYPLGPHLFLGSLLPLAGVSLVAAYQPFIAFAVAMAAAALCAVARAAGLRAPAAGLAAFAAAGGSLLYIYGQLGGLKELVTVTALAAATGVAATVAPREWTARSVVALVVPLAATVPTLSTGGIAYAGLLALVPFGGALIANWRDARDRPRRLRALAGQAAVGVGCFLVLTAFTLADAFRFNSTVNSELSGTQLGQLLRPLPLGQVGGIWWADDWRLPVTPSGTWTLNLVLLVLLFAAAAVGVLVLLRRRRGQVLAGLFAVAAAIVVIGPRTSPYGESKLFVIATPFVVLAAAFGLGALRGRVPRAAGGIVAVALLGGILYSDAIAYRAVRLAPVERMEAMADIADATRGMGLVLHHDNDEWSKYFYRDERVQSPGEIWWGVKPWELRSGFAQVNQFYDLDELQLPYVTQFRAIVTRTSPDGSRPPASFRPTRRNRFYQLWERDPRVTVVSHMPLQRPFDAQLQPSCAAIRRFARRQARPGDELVAARAPQTVVMTPVEAGLAASWKPSPELKGAIVPFGPGRARAERDLDGGRYRVWLQGSSGRPVYAVIDGRRVGAMQQVNTTRQWTDVGSISLPAGRHRLEIVRPGGSLGPGDAYGGQIGPLALQPDRPERLIRVAPGDADRLCGRPLDWVEVVRRAP